MHPLTYFQTEMELNSSCNVFLINHFNRFYTFSIFTQEYETTNSNLCYFNHC